MASTSSSTPAKAEHNIFIELGMLNPADFTKSMARKTDSEIDRLCRAMHVNPFAADAFENLHAACRELWRLWDARLISAASLPQAA